MSALTDWFSDHFSGSGLLVLSCVICLAGGYGLGIIGSASFWALVAQEASILGAVALGLTVLHHSGEFDFSVDAIFACCLVLTGLIAQVLPVELACLMGMTAAGVIGWINGALVQRLRVTLLLTFVLGIVWRQFAQLATDGRPFTVESPATSLLSALAWDSFLGLPLSYWLLLMLAVLVRQFFVRTTLGHNLVATGLDQRKAELLGLDTQRYKRFAFVFSGLLTGLAAVLYFGRLSTADASAGNQMTFLALGAIIIGNSGLTRSQPSPIRIVMAVTLISFLEVAVSSYQGIPPVVNILIGVIIVLALALGRNVQRLSR